MVSKKKLAIAATGLLLLATACGGAAAPTATPTTPATVAPTAEATSETTAEATEEATEVMMEMTEEATMEATEVMMEMTEEATVEATEVMMEMTEEATIEATEVMMEMTEEATMEATEVMMEMTEEATMEATEIVMETTPEATMDAPTKEVGNAIVALIQAAAMQMTPSPTPEATAELTAEATVESTAEATADVVSSTVTEATAEATMDVVAATPAPEATQVAEGGIVWTCPEDFSGQSLNIYNWAEYIGASTITDFMELCPGVEVTMDYFDTNETLITKLRAGNPGFDIAIPSDYAVKILADENLLEPIDLANIPNMANVEQRWKEMYFDPGNVYGVPYLWSSFGILYDKTKVATPPVSWMDYFTYAGPVSWMDDYRGMFGAAFWLMGADASSVDPVEIEKAATFLKENGSNAVMLQGGFLEPLLAGEVDMILTYSAYSYYSQQECGCDDYVYVVPAEGSAIDTQEVVLLKGNDNKRLAEAFMDYLHDPYVNAQLTNDTGYNSTNAATIASGFIKPEIVNNPALFMSPDEANRLEFYRPITEAEGLYQQYWDEIRISLGL